MKASDKFILGTIVLGVLLNIVAAYLDRRYPPLAEYTALILAVVLVLYIAFRIVETTLHYFRYGRYAVLIFFLNGANELLLIRHPFHKCYLPPGGRLQQWELPHEAVAKKLSEEAGISSFELHPLFHNPRLVISDIVEDVPRPYSVHMEHRRQRTYIRFHYAFVYVCRFKDADESLSDVPGYNPRFFDLKSIYAMPRGTIPFSDIIRRYEDILAKIAASQYVSQP